MKKFTLIELLIVVAIIGILVSILIPSLASAREKARYAVCVSNKSQNHKLIMLGVSDNDRNFPLWWTGNDPNLMDRWGSWFQTKRPDPRYDRDDWMGACGKLRIEKYHNWNGPKYGIVNPVAGFYSGHTNWVYTKEEVRNMSKHPLSVTMRCPSLEEGIANSGVGSNGGHDYSFPQALRGLPVSLFGTTVEWYGKEMGTPLVLEEDPYFNKNRGYRETAWGAADTIGTPHDFGKKGTFTAIDGSNNVIRYGLRYSASSRPMVDFRGTLTPMSGPSNTGALSGYSYWNPEEPIDNQVKMWRF